MKQKMAKRALGWMSVLSAAGPEGQARRRWIAAGAAVTVLLVMVVWLTSGRRTAAQTSVRQAERTAKVERRDFIRTLRLHGTVAAVESYPIAAPRLAGQQGGQLLITYLAAGGTQVHKGDLVVEFDRQDQIRNALERRSEYLDLEEQVKKKVAEQAAAQAKDNTELEQAKNARETARLEMRRNEVISRIDAEKNQQNLEEAEARLKQLEQTFELKRVSRRAELRILELRRDRARDAKDYAEKNAERMSLRAPIDGVVVISSMWKGSTMAEVQQGDQVRPGFPVIQVVNPTSMEVRARVNQADIPSVQLGQTAEVRLDAYPSLVFPGKLERIAAIGVAGEFSSRIRTFSVVVSIAGTDPKLLPDLAAAVDAELERRPASLLIPRDAVVIEDGKTIVQVKNGTGWDRRAVKVIAENDAEVAVESGLNEGETVLRAAAGSKAGS